MSDEAGLNLSSWVASVKEAMQDTTMMLGFDVDGVEEQPATPSGLRGAHIALVGNHCAVQLGVLSTAEGSQRLAQAMLEAEEELPEEDVADAMGEIANILVGVMKGAMIHLDEGLKLGLPVFVEGRLEPIANTPSSTLLFQLGDVPLTIAVSVGAPDAQKAA
ncbi:MAG: chemotaxis protein CheX [Myxococcota bacterium]